MIKEFHVKGMSCSSCEKLITKTVKEIKGVKNFKVNAVTGNALISYDNKGTLAEVYSGIEDLGYSIPEDSLGGHCDIRRRNGQITKDKYTLKISINSLKQYGMIGALIITILGGYYLMQGLNYDIPKETNYLLLFITGLTVGFHCIGMCGGFMLATKGKTPLIYGLGKLISYTVIGGLFGLLGSLIIFTPLIRGIAGIIAGVFLVTYGLSNLGVNFLKRVRIPMPLFLNKFIAKNSGKNNQFITGLLNGLMIACGPLQAMYIYAAGTGSIMQGALSLFFFGLGTLPVMIGFGFLTNYISKKTTHKIFKISGALMIMLGLLMLNYGLTLTGTGVDANTLITGITSAKNNNAITIENGYQIIRMTVNSNGWAPDKFVLKAGTPVKWVINVTELTNCNKAIQVPKLGLEFNLKRGEQTIEFTAPSEEGMIPWSCWMGMIPGVFVIKQDINNVTELQNVTLPKTGGCGCNHATNSY